MLWPQLDFLVQKAMRGIPTHEPEDVRQLALVQQVHVWSHLTESKRPQSVFVTEFVRYPRGLWLRIWLAATESNDFEFDYQEVRSAIEHFAKANRCTGLEVCGRAGWLRKCGNVIGDREAVVNEGCILRRDFK